MLRLNSDKTFWFSNAILAGLVCFMTVAISGCRKSGPERSIVSGTVTFNGKPIANGEIRFCPTDNTKGTVSGAPIVNGQYTANAKGGVQIGTHLVKIWAYETDTSDASADERDNGEIQYVPERFNRNSTMTTTVTDQARQTLDFKLDDAGEN